MGAAFFMQISRGRIGFYGKSFVPVLIGIGCSAPAIMVARMLVSENGDAGQAGPMDSRRDKHCCRIAVERPV